MTIAPCNVGVVGLGVMGGGLARNLASRGYRVAVHNRSIEAARLLATQHPDSALVVADRLEGVASALARPRLILLLVPAGGPVDDVLTALRPLLETGDVIVDAGNSHFADTERRVADAADQPWHFVGMGVSGGAEGALHGPSLMPGGDARAWGRLQPVCEAIAAVSEARPCVAWCGRGAAGHFVKMVHNGIEYGDMQLIAEAALLLRRGLALDAGAVADAFAAWNRGELESFLISIAAEIFRVPDPANPGALLLDAVLDRAGQKGTGRWTVQAALDLGLAIPTISAAVDARALSSDVALRARASDLFREAGRAALDGVTLDDVRAALYASRIATYSQGFTLLASASAEQQYGTDLAEVARIWRAGCIIRTRLLDEFRSVLDRGDEPCAAFAPTLRAQIAHRLPAWRRVVAAATRAGLPVPALAASLAWLDTLTTARGSADLLQAQRDSFGAHRYERRDHPGELVHSSWQPASENSAAPTPSSARR
jgi:6-phosphogluconate dehydrogenase